MSPKLRHILCRSIYDIFAIIIACILVLILRALDILLEWRIPTTAYPWITLIPMHILLICKKIGLKRMSISLAVLILSSVITLTTLVFGWYHFSSNSGYRDVDQDKSEVFAERRVMIIVPHQDDEINLLGGVIEEYTRYNSELFVVFVTNGDYHEIPIARYREAIDVLTSLGVPQEQIIFLGYGDQYAKNMPHPYNAPAGEVIPSHFGKTETYGADFHPAYREGHAYTNENYLNDLKSVILDYRPDILFCTDYDSHPEHQAVSLAFEKVMGQILSTDSTYRPIVYKGYAYFTAWLAVNDYYAENIQSTSNFTTSAVTSPYRWSDRVRFPINPESISRSMLGSNAYSTLVGYTSQNAQRFAGRIINGDRVFWQRRTDSLLNSSQITTTSGSANFLNDFMILESTDILDPAHMPYDGVWTPENEDDDKKISVVLPQASDVHSIVLYDHPSLQDNITEIRICFNDHSSIHWDSFAPDGTATEIPVDKKDITSFEIYILSADGTSPGFTEIEAFSAPHTTNERLLKLMDANENFVYDYWTDPSGYVELSIYSRGVDLDPELRSLQINLSNSSCTLTRENGKLLLHCPKGQETILSVCDETNTISDHVLIRNPHRLERTSNTFWQWLERRLFKEYHMETFTDLLNNPAAQWVIEKFLILKYYLIG